MTGTSRYSWLVILALAGAAGCAEYRAVDDPQQAPDPAYCAFCHGSVLEGMVQPGPPLDTRGNTIRKYRGVGAHDVHLAGGGLGAPVPCEACHRVPDAAADAGHMDDPLPAEIRFSGLALTGGVKPTIGIPLDEDGGKAPFDPFSVVTCDNLYCHGATLSGGQAVAPDWNGPEKDLARFSACGACHGYPPPAPHPDSSQCSDCHGDVVAADGTVVDPSRHVDGALDVSGAQSCTACHGGGGSPAPPTDLAGNSDPASPGVGAHRAHLEAAHGLSSVVACEQCHLVPGTVDQAGHLDGDPGAELIFGSLASLGGLSPAWDPVTGQCANVYCHGADRPGGAEQQPIWTDVDGSARACGACHGYPPPAPHPDSSQCSDCHDTATPEGGIDKPEQHVDGQLQIKAADCNACHGNTDNAAPPTDLSGASDKTLSTVGAHQEHLLGPSGLTGPIACQECHVVPAAMGDAGHMDGDGVAEVVFGDLSGTGGLDPAWSTVDVECTNTYCHGATLAGGANTSPQWTTVDGTQAACGSCHGIDPGTGRHPSTFSDHGFMVKKCNNCHQGVANDGATAIEDTDRHVNGTLDVMLQVGLWDPVKRTCTPACHGEESWEEDDE